MKIPVFWVVAPRSPVEIYRSFICACFFYHCLNDGDDKHLWSVCRFLLDYTARPPRKQITSYSSPPLPRISQHIKLCRFASTCISQSNVCEILIFDCMTHYRQTDRHQNNFAAKHCKADNSHNRHKEETRPYVIGIRKAWLTSWCVMTC
jgi:hypothetical protein